MYKPHTKNYETQVKEEWRHSVWGYWKEYTGLNKITKDKQYWTLGDSIYKDNTVAGELKAIMEYGLLESLESFVTVNNERKKSCNNIPNCIKCGEALEAHPQNYDHIYVKPQWSTLYGPIEEIVPIAQYNNKFNPAFINLDTTHMPTKAYKLAGNIVRYCPVGTLIALNIIDAFMSRKVMIDEVRDFKVNTSLEHKVSMHETDIKYKNGNCSLVTVFLEIKNV